jgi:hypothetical protein
LPFEESQDPLECFRRELLLLEREVRECMDGTTVERMVPAARREHREAWLAAVNAAAHYTELAQPMIDLEAVLAGALGLDAPLDESIRIYARFIRRRKRGAKQAGAKGKAGKKGKQEKADAMEVAKDGEGDDDEEGDEDEDEEEAEDEAEEEAEAEEEPEEEDVAAANGAGPTPSETAEGPVFKRIKLSGKATGPHKKGRSKTAVQALAITERELQGREGGEEEEEEEELPPGHARAAEARIRRELRMLQGPISKEGRGVWRQEVLAAQTPWSLALCLYAFCGRAYAELPRLVARVGECKLHERLAYKSIKDNVEAAQVWLPTKEVMQVLWARLPKGPYWPAIRHVPYRRAIRRQLREAGHTMLRFMGETAVYHVRSTAVLPYADQYGNECVEVLKRGKAMDKALRTAEMLYKLQVEEAAAGARCEFAEEDEADAAGMAMGGVDEDTADLEAAIEEAAALAALEVVEAPPPPAPRRKSSGGRASANQQQLQLQAQQMMVMPVAGAAEGSETDTDEELAAPKANGRARGRRGAGRRKS